ncbi:Rv0361 family membrane protein [Nocardia sp. NBC_00416]|uniref:Rv0361 family membrane protein n=1 Tax=Nocardia sp. NBC_00416 TaxID=2975991 RepID=UPI002E1B7886
MIVGAAVAAIVVVAGIAAAVVLTMQGKTPLSSDEQQVEAALRDFYGTLTDEGFRAATDLACKADRDDFAAMSDSEKSEAEKLEFTVEVESVDNIVVTGDRAEAEIKGKFSFAAPGDDSDDQMDDSSDETLVKEDGEWHVCSSAGSDGA